MQIHILGTNLPGRARAATGDLAGLANIHVGVQRRDRPGELLDLHAGDAPTAEWTVDCTTTATPAGIDCTGPYIQGRPGQRFIYLSWGDLDAEGAFAMFRRAKLMFEDIDPEILQAAQASGRLIGQLGLADSQGLPICARVRPPKITWSAG